MSTTKLLTILIIVAIVLELLSFADLTVAIHTLLGELITGEVHTAFLSASFIGGWLFSLLSITDTRQQKITTTLAGFFLAGGLAFLTTPKETLDIVAVFCTGLGIAGFMRLIFNTLKAPNPQARQQCLSVTVEAALIPAFVLISNAGLMLTAALRPHTYDLIAYRLDLVLLGDTWMTGVIQSLESLPWLTTFFQMVYMLLPLFMLWIRYEQLKDKNNAHVNAITAFLYVSAVGYLLYFIAPVSGPLYAFGQFFPDNLPPLEQTPSRLMPTMMLSARNGIPSLHMAWGMMIFLCSLSLKPLHIISAGILMVLTAISALGFGEHYLVDILIAIPFAFVMYLLAHYTDTRQMDKRLFILTLVSTLIMLLTVMFWTGIAEQPFLFSAVIFLVLPALCIYQFSRSMKSLLQGLSVDPQVTDANPALENPDAATPYERQLFALFVLSGFAALVYQVLFAKKLALIFGSAAIATYTVLATYMMGIALGSLLGGWLGQRVKNKIKAYATAEILIAVYCMISPLLFTLIQSAYLSAAGNISPDATVLSVYRVILGGVVLLIPTLAMGMTTPLLVAAVTRHKGLGDSVGLLYGANTLGAASGAMLTGYLIMPVLGMQNTLLIAVMLNLMAGVIALQLQKKYPAMTETSPVGLPHYDAARSTILSFRFNSIFLLLFLVGFVTLAMETFYIQLLAVVAGNSAYAFSLMLFTFLLGLGCGAITCRWLMSNSTIESSAYVFTGLVMVAFAILLGNYGWDNLPGYFLSFEKHSLAKTFAAREVIRGIVCFIMMFPVAYAIGFMYPASMEIVGKLYPKKTAIAFGIGSAVNTLGNILGVVIGGFILLPLLGGFNSLLVAATIMAMCAAFVAVYLLPRQYLQYTLPVLAIMGMMFFIQPSGYNMTHLASGANVYFSSQYYGEVIDHSESIDGGLTTISMLGEKENPTLTLLTNGKFQGDNSKDREMAAQVGFALAPLLHQTHRESALVIGYGTGVSARAISDAGFNQLDIVEISSDIFTMADKYFLDVNDNVRSRNNTASYVTDGRNFLFLHEKKYDVISMEISSIWFAGAANLYNQEFYALARSRLKDDGVFQQWVQLHRITETDILTVLNTVRTKFDYVWLYFIGGQGIIVATNDVTKRPSQESIVLLNNTPTLKKLLGLYGGKSEEVLKTRILDPQAIDELLSVWVTHPKALLSTDDNLMLEYTTPKGNVRTYESSINQNLNFLIKYSPPVKDLLRGTSL